MSNYGQAALIRIERTSCRETRALTSKGRANIEEPTVVIYEVPSQGMSFVVKDALQNAGFPVAEMVDAAYQTEGSVPRPSHYSYSRLLTLESRAEEARQFITDLLAAIERGELEIREE